ncbi:MAG: DUF2244 domain-containing protein [Ideonella sp.]
MSATTTPIDFSVPASSRHWQFGRETRDAEGGWQIEWLLKRNCSLAPGQMLGLFGVLCLISMTIAIFFWLQGARMVMSFAWVELICVGAAMLLYARHAADRECIELQHETLTVEHSCGSRVDRVEFHAAWVRVEPRSGDQSLVELTGQGRRIFVGRFIRPELRRKLADELRVALRRPYSQPVNAA